MHVFQIFFDLECYRYGMKRAMIHLIHFGFFRMLEYNKLEILVFPLLYIMVVKINFFAIWGKDFKMVLLII